MGAVFSRVAALRALKSLLGARGSLLLHPSLDISFSVGWLKLERILSFADAGLNYCREIFYLFDCLGQTSVA